MTCTRDELKEAARDLGWAAVDSRNSRVDIYRAVPYSVMVEFSRDGMIIAAQLFGDAPEARQQLPPRLLAEVGKNNANKRRRIRSWFYDYRQAAAG